MIESISVSAVPSPLATVPARCVAEGRLINKSGCFALRQSDGCDIWLEMDRIPMHLIEAQVRVQGVRFQPDFISVEAVGPA